MPTITFKELGELSDNQEVWRSGKFYEVQKQEGGVQLNWKGRILLPDTFVSHAVLRLFSQSETGFILPDETCWEHT